ncbi:hypothetical protein X801_00077 [Opisthorchis viverrini]|uniref:Uncharacterized protein n=1 Tax=Opisthorchis viverrini TaxID=6198 RepID=A0A1S8XC56_OPIVI|nr:hypothetical protein X801_00077 [Opisthorchis viverrini]
MAEKKPNEWVQLLLLRFDSQLPIRTGLHTAQSTQNMEQNKECLITVSKCKFSLVISGLTKMLQNIDSMIDLQIDLKEISIQPHADDIHSYDSEASASELTSLAKESVAT